MSSKGLIYGFRKVYPESKVIGYQGIIDSASYRINIRPTKYERDNSLTPDIIAVIGDSLIQQVKEFDKNIKVISSPAFRYHYLWDRERKINNDHFTILVALPIFYVQAENILAIINSALNNPIPSTFLCDILGAEIGSARFTYTLVFVLNWDSSSTGFSGILIIPSYTCPVVPSIVI